ncbi:DUF3040 domain-containing protein [Nonomuraea gerenzanensis]|uniref:Uncharacterized protein n=1 Tax=Nonomuraea gerenzanensis TaxID=93944 RepID=A0A1M4EB10_9ACTN|nr:DUF3040 domain-containing protein [Nonomuraea gerenzanensis]UBU18168.1 DUF3040 domain-containing protein [Nonomuraea gerenzanensis]SBO95980.1 hypothetical protein BN4615_P5496 [Nonomuraea gerenzanensis]
MDGLSPQERLVLAAIELELRHNGERLASRLSEFNERAEREGPRRFCDHVSRAEVAVVGVMVLILTGIVTLVIVTCK